MGMGIVVDVIGVVALVYTVIGIWKLAVNKEKSSENKQQETTTTKTEKGK